MLYNAGFLVLIPIVYAMGRATGMPLTALGVPLAASLSAAHGFLPPHPAPTYVAFAYGASVNATLFAGLAAAVPACLIAGVLFGRLLPRIAPDARGAVPAGLADAEAAAARDDPARPLPGLAVSVATALVPVVLMLVGAVVDVAAGTAGVDPGRDGDRFAERLAVGAPDPAVRALVSGAKFVGNAERRPARRRARRALRARRAARADDGRADAEHGARGGGDRHHRARHRRRRGVLAGAARRRRGDYITRGRRGSTPTRCCSPSAWRRRCGSPWGRPRWRRSPRRGSSRRSCGPAARAPELAVLATGAGA
jgi:hypothetical protein